MVPYEEVRYLKNLLIRKYPLNAIAEIWDENPELIRSIYHRETFAELSAANDDETNRFLRNKKRH